jgi:hypothetical protein
VFPVGTTTVSCSATDSGGTRTTVTTRFTVTVKDVDLAIAQAANTTADATGPSGATVIYPAPAVADPDDTQPGRCVMYFGIRHGLPDRGQHGAGHGERL